MESRMAFFVAQVTLQHFSFTCQRVVISFPKENDVNRNFKRSGLSTFLASAVWHELFFMSVSRILLSRKKWQLHRITRCFCGCFVHDAMPSSSLNFSSHHPPQKTGFFGVFLLMNTKQPPRELTITYLTYPSVYGKFGTSSTQKYRAGRGYGLVFRRLPGNISEVYYIYMYCINNIHIYIHLSHVSIETCIFWEKNTFKSIHKTNKPLELKANHWKAVPVDTPSGQFSGTWGRGRRHIRCLRVSQLDGTWDFTDWSYLIQLLPSGLLRNTGWKNDVKNGVPDHHKI